MASRSIPSQGSLTNSTGDTKVDATPAQSDLEERGQAAVPGIAGEQPIPNPEGQVVDLDVDSQQDNDSAIGIYSDYSSTQSLRDSIYDYVEENGRKYHRYKQGNYLLPNDQGEQDRLDFQHHLFLLTFDGKLNLAPIEDMPGGLNHVIDIGTGTGIWAVEFASAFPTANVLGTDLSPIQPEFIPTNCRFEIDDAEDDWLFSHKLDYVHGRALMSCFKDQRTVWRNALNSLRPGGYIELQDVQMPYRYVDSSGEGTAVKLFNERFMEGALKLGRDFTKVQHYKRVLEEVGFVDVVERQFVWPVGTWPRGKKMKLLGAWFRENSLAGLHGGAATIMTRGLGMTHEEVEKFLVDVKKDLRSNLIHAYVPVYVVYGRKPEN